MARDKHDKGELLKWYESIKTDNAPRYVEISSASNRQVFFNGRWQNAVYAWGIFFNGSN